MGIFNNNFIREKIKRKAYEFGREKTILETFGLAFGLALILSLITSAISIYSSTGFLQDFVEIMHLNNWQAWILAIILEIFTITLLYGFLYNMHKVKIISMVFILPFALSMYVLNFYTSTTGLKERAEKQENDKKQIRENYTKDSLRIYQHYRTRIDSLLKANAAISDENTGYNHTQLKHNNEMISDLREEFKTKKKRLRKNKYKKIEENSEEVANAGLRNYKVIVINQILQFVLHLLISIFYMKVYYENLSIKEATKEQAKKIQGVTKTAIQKDIASTYNQQFQEIKEAMNSDSAHSALNNTNDTNNNGETDKPETASEKKNITIRPKGKR